MCDDGGTVVESTSEGKPCRLCNRVAPLCRSHIIPECLYAPLKNEKGRMHCLGRDEKLVQKGHTERLLCSQCENLLSRYENGFKKVWMDTIPPNFANYASDPRRDAISVHVPDYSQFKLFHLSVFWRAAVSRLKADASISLGKYERQIADLLLAEDPGEPGDFPFLGTLILHDSKEPATSITPLMKGLGRVETHRYYGLQYAFCEWVSIVCRSEPGWLSKFEAKCREEGVFLLLISSFSDAKLTRAWAPMVRQLFERIHPK